MTSYEVFDIMTGNQVCTVQLPDALVQVGIRLLFDGFYATIEKIVVRMQNDEYNGWGGGDADYRPSDSNDVMLYATIVRSDS